MSVHSAALQDFFDRYGRALASGDLEIIADAYAYPSLILGGPETIVVSEREDVKRAFTGAAQGYRAQGLTKAAPTVQVIDGDGVGTLWVAVRWTYSADDGSHPQHDAYRYLLRDDEGSFTIVALTAAPVEDR